MRPLPPEHAQTVARIARACEMAAGFEMHFLFLDAEDLADAMAERLDTLLRIGGRRAEIAAPVVPEDVAPLVSRVEGAPRKRHDTGSALWLQLNRQGGVPAWDAGRRAVLAGLNQRRGWLQARFARPLVVALPQGWQPEVWRLASDLWTIRSTSAGFDATGSVDGHRGDVGTARLPGPSAIGVEKESRIRAWRELMEKRRQGLLGGRTVDPRQGLEAVQVALRMKALGLAQEILSDVRSTVGQDDEDSRNPRLAGLIEGLAGDVARALGRWEEAGRRYGQSLAYGEQLRGLVGETPEVLADLVTCMVRLGSLAALPDGAARLDEAEVLLHRLTAENPLVERYRKMLEGLPEVRASVAGRASAGAKTGEQHDDIDGSKETT